MTATPEFQVPPRCPKCDRLTVDNKQHCAEKTPGLWANVCRWMVCKNDTCKTTYGPEASFTPKPGAS